MHADWGLIAFWVWDVGHVGGHFENLELIVYREANFQTVDGIAGFFRSLTWDDEGVGFDIGERGFDVPKAIFSFKTRINHGSRL